MRTNTLTCFGFLLAAVCLAVPSATAQNPRVSVAVGGSFVQGDRNFTISADNFTTRFVDGGKVKARFTLDLTNSFSIEGSYSFGRNNLRVQEVDGTPEERSFGMELGDVKFSVLHFFTGSGSHVRPFLTAGIGAVRYEPTDEAKALALADEFVSDAAVLAATTRVSFGFGGGIEGRFNRWVGIRFDVRDDLTPIPRFGLPETSSGPGGIFFPVNGITHNIETSVGVVFYFLP